MKAYFWAFVKFKQNDKAKLLPMAEFAYNNTKNASSSHIPFELNYSYYSWISYKKDVNPYSKSKSGNELSAKLRKLITVYRENFHQA